MNKRFAALANLVFSSSHAVFTIVTGLLMVPIYLRFFNMSAYGAWLASGNIIAMLALIEPGISTVATQRLAACYGKGDGRGFADVFGSSLVLTGCFALVVGIAGVGLAPFIPGWIAAPDGQKQDLSSALCLSTVGTATSFFFYVLGAAPQAWQRTVAPGVIGILGLSANIAAILIGLNSGLGLISLGLGPLAMSLTYVVGYLAYIVATWHKLKLPAPTASIATAREIWREARMLLLAKIAGAAGKYLEAPAAALAVSTEAAAVLVLTGRVLMAVQMFADRVGTAVFAGMAHAFASYREDHSLAVTREVIVVSTIICGLGIGFSLAFSEPVIKLWVGMEAYGGTLLLLLLAVASILSSRKDLLSTLLVASGQVRRASLWLAVEAGIRVVLIALFVMMFKVPGIPLAAALASLLTLAALCRILVTMPGMKGGLLLTPGLKGFGLSMLCGGVYLVASPMPNSWSEAAVHGALFGALVLILNLMDKEWAAVLRKTFIATRCAVSRSHGG